MEKYTREKLDVSMHTQSAPNMRVMRGKALLDDEAKDFKFVENSPRGPRSVEIGRTVHSRFVRRPDGLYTVTFRCDASTKYLRETLTAEVAEIVRLITADKKLQSNGKRKGENLQGNDEKEATEGKDKETGKGRKKNGDAPAN